MKWNSLGAFGRRAYENLRVLSHGTCGTDDRIGAHAGATTDPQVQIYRFTGLRDDNAGPNAGVAAVIHCSNFSGASEIIRVQVRNYDAAVKADLTRGIGHNETR